MNLSIRCHLKLTSNDKDLQYKIRIIEMQICLRFCNIFCQNMNTKKLTKINKKEKSKCVFCARLLEGAKYVSLGPTEHMGTVRIWPNQL